MKSYLWSSVVVGEEHTTTAKMEANTNKGGRGDMNTVELLLGFWPTSSNDLDNNYYTYFDWMATMNNIPNWQPDSLQVLALASKCPATNGNIVYTAQNLYDSLTGEHREFFAACNAEPIVFANKSFNINPSPNQPINLFPNPANNYIHIIATNAKQIDIVNAMGKLMGSHRVKADDSVLNIASLPTGWYCIKIIDTQNKLSTRTIFKQ